MFVNGYKLNRGLCSVVEHFVQGEILLGGNLLT